MFVNVRLKVCRRLRRTVRRISYKRLLDGVLHDVSPVVVDDLKHLSLLGHLLHDVLGREDRIEVQPLSLDLQPLVDRLLDLNHPLLPLAYLLLERLDERRASHRLDPDRAPPHSNRQTVTAVLPHKHSWCREGAGMGIYGVGMGWEYKQLVFLR